MNYFYKYIFKRYLLWFPSYSIWTTDDLFYKTYFWLGNVIKDYESPAWKVFRGNDVPQGLSPPAILEIGSP